MVGYFGHLVGYLGRGSTDGLRPRHAEPGQAAGRRGFGTCPTLPDASLRLPANFHVRSGGRSLSEYVLKGVPRTQFIAALGDPAASSGTGASSWGIWRLDPGPRGVFLAEYGALAASGGVARAGWQFDPEDWWLEEHGLIMEKPEFPLPPGRYVVTGGRELTTVLTVGADGDSWSLEKGTLHDVTHLPCRSARYTPLRDGASPAAARVSDFPVTPGAAMPDVDGSARQDYWVLFVTGLEVAAD